MTIAQFISSSGVVQQLAIYCLLHYNQLYRLLSLLAKQKWSINWSALFFLLRGGTVIKCTSIKILCFKQVEQFLTISRRQLPSFLLFNDQIVWDQAMSINWSFSFIKIVYCPHSMAKDEHFTSTIASNSLQESQINCPLVSIFTTINQCDKTLDFPFLHNKWHNTSIVFPFLQTINHWSMSSSSTTKAMMKTMPPC